MVSTLVGADSTRARFYDVMSEVAHDAKASDDFKFIRKGLTA